VVIGAGLGLAALAALAWRFAGRAAADNPPAAPPAVPVESALVAVKNVPAILPALGTALSVDTVNVMPQVNGRTKVGSGAASRVPLVENERPVCCHRLSFHSWYQLVAAWVR
jgi:hypothetical protein